MMILQDDQRETDREGVNAPANGGGLFTKEDMVECLLAVGAWQVPACTAVYDAAPGKSQDMPRRRDHLPLASSRT